MRTATCNRMTAETEITLTLNLDGTGKGDIMSGVGFLDHMLTLFARHARFDLAIRCAGDTNVDDHHSVEDVAIALGEALKESLSEKRGIVRYGSQLLPMDEALVLCAVDLSGRGSLRYTASIPSQKIGSFDTELVQEFFMALSRTAGITLHIRQLDGENSHHIVEAMFKSLGRALKQAVAIDPAYADEIPSTKGVL
ncbi:MAG: imidazoleglycerol-phosphate dehydratase HisB [Eubacteriales bacterium]|nr:imidazoleglycerol-phosphate dehydratase HisB [Eubacteriales bacterium]